MRTIADNLRRLRRQEGLTQRELALDSEVPLCTLQAYEEERHVPGLVNLRKIKKRLQCDWEGLLGP